MTRIVALMMVAAAVVVALHSGSVWLMLAAISGACGVAVQTQQSVRDRRAAVRVLHLPPNCRAAVDEARSRLVKSHRGRVVARHDDLAARP